MRVGDGDRFIMLKMVNVGTRFLAFGGQLFGDVFQVSRAGDRTGIFDDLSIAQSNSFIASRKASRAGSPMERNVCNALADATGSTPSAVAFSDSICWRCSFCLARSDASAEGGTALLSRSACCFISDGGKATWAASEAPKIKAADRPHKEIAR